MQSHSYHHQEDAFILKNDEASILCRNPCQLLQDIVARDTNPALSDFTISSVVLGQAAFVPSGSLLKM